MKNNQVSMLLDCVILFLATLTLIIFLNISHVYAHDPARPELNDWYHSLKSKSGMPCCDGSDSQAVAADDWKSVNGHYSVMIDGKWEEVPDRAVIEEPNLAQKALIWRRESYMNGMTILCFMPGSMM